MTTDVFIKKSLELNMFFLRIMKEHAFFIAISLPPKNDMLINQAKELERAFENLLLKTIQYSHGILKISEMDVTSSTLYAESKTTFLTGSTINTNITEEQLKPLQTKEKIDDFEQQIRNLNNEILVLLNKIIDFKNRVYDLLTNCQIYASIYPTQAKHILNEAIMYAHLLITLQEGKDQTNILYKIVSEQSFWDDILTEHSEFAEGFLDPTEVNLKRETHDLADIFEKIKNKITKTKSKQEILLITNDTIAATKQMKKFNTTATENLINCKIKSLILPLLADHLLREASYYLNLLETHKKDLS